MRDFQAPGRSLVYANNGMCATSHPLATKVALAVLEQAGGNAVDAAVAAAFLLGQCEPPMTGIGGDCFALLAPHNADRLIGLNASGRAPKALTADALRNLGCSTVPTDHVHAVTVPGAVDGLLRLQADHGILDLPTVLAPAIRYAEEGVPVAPRVAHDWALAAGRLQGHAARSAFLLDGRAPKPGDNFRMPGQAAVLREVARLGRRGFYEGHVAEDMVASLRGAGGLHTMEDFAQTQATYVEPIVASYRGAELVELPPNGQGATALLMGKILQEFPLGRMHPMGSERAHIEAEAAKLAYLARDRFLADPTVAEVNLDAMMSDAKAKSLAGLIDPNACIPNPRAASEAVHKDTVYLTVVDKQRTAVSLIYSIFEALGSGIASDKYNILFQNRGANFSLAPGHPNELQGGKRPLHTIIPGMLRQNGKLTMSFGVMGGFYQPTGHMRLISNLLDYGMNLQQAIDAPRTFAYDGVLLAETGVPAAVRHGLEERGHKVVTPVLPIGGAQAIWIDHETGVLTGASDPRKDGCAMGY